MKGYCKNCKYHRYDDIGFLECFKDISEPYSAKGYSGFNVEMNGFGKICQYYKRTWWKFWVR